MSAAGWFSGHFERTLIAMRGIGRCRWQRRVNGRWAALVDAGFLRLGDALELALFPQVGFELGEDAEHIEEALADSRDGIDRLLGGLQIGRDIDRIKLTQ
jgi:hypothetical protein